MKMYVAGAWREGNEALEVRNPFDGTIVDTVPKASLLDVEQAISSATRGALAIRSLPAFERSRILKSAAELIQRRADDLARLITLEEGKIIAEARFEVSRAVETLMLSAEEAKRIAGEVVPLDGAPGGGMRFGFTLRIPCGVVLAISPFNFPLNLVTHKVGPALAAGNSVILKPATDTPLSALTLTGILLEAGLPAEAIQCVTGSGSDVGHALCADSRIRKISFTGSREVGEQICKIAGLKRLTMELGSNSPLIVMPDANLETVSQAIAITGFSNAGQVCISTQRVLALKPVYSDLLSVVKTKVEKIQLGNPLSEDAQMGPMIREQDAARVESWINQALSDGARLIVGGERDRALYKPTIVADALPEMRICNQELFGPAVAISPCESIDEAVELANRSNYGLSAGIFTQNLDWAMKFAREVEAGNLHVNWGPQWRADLMPYGGLKDSGFGKEGPKYAIREMTDAKMVVFH
jgi:glyceraldehyde-3-phosphate dehydrogenase (NADP+)